MTRVRQKRVRVFGKQNRSMKTNLFPPVAIFSSVRTLFAVFLILSSLPLRAALLDLWDAASLTNAVTDGADVIAWTSESNRVATLDSGTAPVLVHEATPAQLPAVRFGGTGRLTLPGTNSVVGGQSAFTLAIVFQAAAAGANDNAQWWGKSGLIDAEEGGSTADWGTVIDETGNIGFGIGGDDNTIYTSVGSTVDARYHVAVFTWGGGMMNLHLDDYAPVSTSTSVPTAPRNAAAMAIGAVAGSTRYFNGDIAEFQFYDTAFDTAQASNLITELAGKHGIVFPEVITSFNASTNVLSEGESLTLSWETAAGASLSIDPDIGDVTSQTTNGVGGIEVTPDNDVTYTLTATQGGITRFAEVDVVVQRSATGSLLDVWDAASLDVTLMDSDPVTNWPSLGGRVATAAADSPVYREFATAAGTPTVSFNNTLMRVMGAENPVGGLAEFTLAYVFRVNAQPTANDNAQWWGQTGVVDAEQPGSTADWGSALRVDGQVGLGIGGNDITVYSEGSSLVDPIFHVVVATWGNGTIRLLVDDRDPIEATMNVPLAPRNVADLAFGGIQTGEANRQLVGEVAEIQFYDENLITSEAMVVRDGLITKHGLFFPTVLTSFAAVPPQIQAGAATELQWMVDPGSTVEISPGIGDVTSQTVNGVGSISVIPTNDIRYTITVTDLNGVIRAGEVLVEVQKTAANSLADVWDAASLTSMFADQDPVSLWQSEGGREAVAEDPVATETDLPLFIASATAAGTPALRMSNSVLRVDATNSVVGGLSEFTLAYVVRVHELPTMDAGDQWFQESGIVDAEENGSTADWGSSVDENGRFSIGIGGPDTTLHSADTSAGDGQFHIVVVQWGAGRSAISVDGGPAVVSTNPVPTAPLNIAPMVFGGIQTGEGGADRRLNGDLAEIRFYDDNLAAEEVAAVVEELAAKHQVEVSAAAVILGSMFGAGGEFVVQWRGLDSVDYTLMRKASLAPEEPFVQVGDAITATGGEQEFVDPTPPADMAFYVIATP